MAGRFFGSLRLLDVGDAADFCGVALRETGKEEKVKSRCRNGLHIRLEHRKKRCKTGSGVATFLLLDIVATDQGNDNSLSTAWTIPRRQHQHVDGPACAHMAKKTEMCSDNSRVGMRYVLLAHDESSVSPHVFSPPTPEPFMLSLCSAFLVTGENITGSDGQGWVT